MPHLALYTFGVLKAPNRDPGRLTREFYETTQAIYAGIGQSAGYIAHADAADRSGGTLFDWHWGSGASSPLRTGTTTRKPLHAFTFHHPFTPDGAPATRDGTGRSAGQTRTGLPGAP